MAKLDADIKATVAENERQAKFMNVTVDEYMKAKAASGRAYASCKVGAEARAKYDYKADWIPSYIWTVKDKVISVVGHDLRMQNGFGVFGSVTYFCDYSMVSDRVTSVLINQD